MNDVATNRAAYGAAALALCACAARPVEDLSAEGSGAMQGAEGSESSASDESTADAPPVMPPPMCDWAPPGMACVAAGPFWRGCDPSWPQHCLEDFDAPRVEVQLDAFAIDLLETTVAEYASCVEAGACAPAGTSEGCNAAYDRPTYPIDCVSWELADAYCAWRGKRLPSEAEWEKAARGIDDREWPWGNQDADCERAVLDDGQDGCGSGKGAPVGSKPAGASPYGVLDMAGNTLEWVADWYDSGYYTEAPSDNPPGPSTGTERVVRGGNWLMTAYGARTWLRLVPSRAYGEFATGFRCAQSP